MKNKISVVINTFNEESNIDRCLKSVSWADDVVIVDMNSQDETVNIAKRYKTRIYEHDYVKYVEPARNYAISKAKNRWVLVVDADEVIPKTLVRRLIELTKQSDITHVLIPRKNIVLGKWLQYSAEWANHQTRFFKKNLTFWDSKIHKQPVVKGNNYVLEPDDKYAILHYYYSTIDEFLKKLDTYTLMHAIRIMNNKDFKIRKYNLFSKPLKEFIQRYFISKGVLDGQVGFIHCALMSYYYFLVYLRIYELDMS